MKFDYKEDEVKVAPEAKAFLYLFHGGPQLCLAVRVEGGVVWFYEDGEVSFQPQETLNGEDDEGLIKRFYEGDTATLTF